MTAGLKIATIRGIPIRIHPSFLLVLPLIAYVMGVMLGQAAEVAEVPPERLSGSPWVWGLAVGILLFASVLVHELAHSLYALAKGGKVKGITLMIIGGVSQLAEAPKKPREEAIMAAVGPLTSMGLSALFFAGWSVLEGTQNFNLRFAVFQLFYLNAILGVFNLLPAFPMDGGRILRALLSRRMGPERATRTAAGVGRGFAVAFGILGILGLNFILVLIAIFIWMGAKAEAQHAQAEAVLGALRVRDVMTPAIDPLHPEDSLLLAAERMVSERVDALPVQSGHRVSLVTLAAIQEVGADSRLETPVRRVAVRTPTVSPEDNLAAAFRTLASEELPQLAVMEDGRLVGSLSWEGISRAMRMKEIEHALEVRRGGRGHRPIPGGPGGGRGGPFMPQEHDHPA